MKLIIDAPIGKAGYNDVVLKTRSANAFSTKRTSTEREGDELNSANSVCVLKNSLARPNKNSNSPEAARTSMRLVVSLAILVDSAKNRNYTAN